MMSQTTDRTYYSIDVVRPDRPPLEGSRQFDAVVVGAGYAGISAAIEFASMGMSVIVLERAHVGAGASGKNGGIFLPNLSEGPHSADAEVSRAVDEALVAAARELVALAEEHRIDADLRRGTIRLAITARQAKRLAKAAARTGPTVDQGEREFLDRQALGAYLRSERYTGGLLDRGNITLNPHKLLEGLAVLAEKNGAVIAENSGVKGIETSPAGGVVVLTAGGEVRAKRLVVAAGSGTGEVLPSHRRTLIPGYSQIAVTEPLDDALLDSVLPSWMATSEIATFTRYFRRLPGNRLLFGIASVLDSIAGPKLEGQIRAELRDTFPALGDVRFDSAWEGEMASTVDETPLLDRIAPSAVVTACNGVLPSWNTGRIAARATDPAYAAYDFVRINQHSNWPPFGLPEKLVKTGAKALFRVMDRL